MAEENEKKPEFVVHKKQQDSSLAATEKKRVVVVKRKQNQTPNAQNAQKQPDSAQKKSGVHVVVKKPAAPQKQNQQTSDVANTVVEKNAEKTANAVAAFFSSCRRLCRRSAVKL